MKTRRALQQETSQRNELLLEELSQVKYVARSIHEHLPQHLELADLVQAGIVGWMDAFEKFDPEKDVQFRTYAKFRIRGAILDSLRECDWGPRDLRRKARKVEEVTAQITVEQGRPASEQEIADALEIPLAEFQHLLGEIEGLGLGSLQMERGVEGHEQVWESLADDEEVGPDALCMKSQMRDVLLKAIGELPERERRVLSMYYFEEKKMKDIGREMGVRESRVSQIHSMALVRLRARLEPMLGQCRRRPVPESSFVSAVLTA